MSQETQEVAVPREPIPTPGAIPLALPLFKSKFHMKAILSRVESSPTATITSTELGYFIGEIADTCLDATLMKGSVSPAVQRKIVSLFISEFPHLVLRYPEYTDKSVDTVRSKLVQKLSRRLSMKRSRSSGPAGHKKEREERVEGVHRCRPGERLQRTEREQYPFTHEEEEARLELINAMDDPDYDEDDLWDLWAKTLNYRRAEVNWCKWTEDPDNPGFMYRKGMRKVLKRWPHLLNVLFMAYDFDYVTNYVGGANQAMHNYKRFTYLALLYFSNPKSGVLKRKSNKFTIQKSGKQRVEFELPLPEIMELVNALYKPGSTRPSSKSDEGRMLRYIPVYGMFERFNEWPVEKAQVGPRQRKRGLVMEEMKTGRKVLNAEIYSYKLYAEGFEISIAEPELIDTVLTSMIAAYTLNLALPGQEIRQPRDVRDFPRAYQALAKALLQNADGTGSFPLMLEPESFVHKQVKAWLDGIFTAEATTGTKAVPRDILLETKGLEHHRADEQAIGSEPSSPNGQPDEGPGESSISLVSTAAFVASNGALAWQKERQQSITERQRSSGSTGASSIHTTPNSSPRPRSVASPKPNAKKGVHQLAIAGTVGGPESFHLAKPGNSGVRQIAVAGTVGTSNSDSDSDLETTSSAMSGNALPQSSGYKSASSPSDLEKRRKGTPIQSHGLGRPRLVTPESSPSSPEDQRVLNSKPCDSDEDLLGEAPMQSAGAAAHVPYDVDFGSDESVGSPGTPEALVAQIRRMEREHAEEKNRLLALLRAQSNPEKVDRSSQDGVQQAVAKRLFQKSALPAGARRALSQPIHHVDESHSEHDENDDPEEVCRVEIPKTPVKASTKRRSARSSLSAEARHRLNKAGVLGSSQPDLTSASNLDEEEEEIKVAADSPAKSPPAKNTRKD